MKKITFIICSLLLNTLLLPAQNYFTTTWKVEDPVGPTPPSIHIPTDPDYIYDYDVDLDGDGEFEIVGVSGDFQHDFAAAGTYTISIRGDFPAIRFDLGGDHDKLLSVDQWGDIKWASMAYAFYGCSKLQILATDAPDLSKVTDMSAMLAYCTSFNQNINHWNVGNVTKMNGLFAADTLFNQPLDSWEVSNVRDMRIMFYEASAFNQNLGGWDVSEVREMDHMLAASALSTANYDSLLFSWSELQLQSNVSFSTGSTFYCAGEDARQAIIDQFGWTITDGGRYCPSDHFVTTWNTENPGAGKDPSITIAVSPTETYNFDIDWNNDGVFDTTGVTGQITHPYSKQGIYTIRIRGLFPAFRAHALEGYRLISVDQWGANPWKSMDQAFSGCINLNIKATDKPDLSNVEDMSRMFAGCASFNHDIGDWDVSNVKYMGGLFSGCSSFNQDLSNWDVSRVIGMSALFAECIRFNQPLNTWQVDSVGYMEGMFEGATSFNQPLDNWNTGSLEGAEAISSMFKGASSFNQIIAGWDLSKVTHLDGMFEDAASFDQNLGNWNVSNVQSMSNMFTGAGLPTPHYDSLLIGWSHFDLQPNVNFSAGNSTYCAGEDARQAIIDQFGWTISDAGLDCTITGTQDPVVRQLRISPNPTTGPVRLDLEAFGPVRLFRVIDGSGRQFPATVERQAAIWAIDLSALPAGIFFLQAVGDEGSATARVIKQ